MKQQDILAVLKHIVDRQVVNKPDKVFRFKSVSKTRKTRDEELRKPANYPGDVSEESDVPVAERPRPVKKTRKPRAKKTAPQDKVGRALQQEMEGLMHVDPQSPVQQAGPQQLPATAATADEPVTEQPEENAAPEEQPDPLDRAVQHPVAPNYGGIPDFGPNDEVQHPWPKPSQGTAGMFGRYRLPLTPGPIEPYPAGIPPEDIGVIDPSLIGLRANTHQLPTPRASVTPQLSPLKLRSDSSAISNLRYEVNVATTIAETPAPLPPALQASSPAGGTEPDVPVDMSSPPPPGARITRSKTLQTADERNKVPPKAKAKQPAKRGRPPKTAPPGETDVASTPAPAVVMQAPPKPRPRGKAAKDLAVTGASAPTIENQPAQPTLTPSRRNADLLAVAEAAQLDLPAKRVRTGKVRTT